MNSAGSLFFGCICWLLLLGGIVFVLRGLFGSRSWYCTVCQKPIKPIGGFLTRRRCPMCRNSGTLQRL